MNVQQPMRGKWMAFPITLLVILSWITGPILVGFVKNSPNAYMTLQILSVIVAFLLFLTSNIMMIAVGAYVAAGKRNLPLPEELGDGVYHIVDDFYSHGRHYYKVKTADNSKILLIESPWMLPPDETRPLPSGYYPHPGKNNDRFEVQKGKLYPVYSGSIT